MPDSCLSQASVHSMTSFASTEVKKEPFVLISYHQWNKAAAQESILLDPLNTEGFCKRNSTTSTYKMHSLEGVGFICSFNLYWVPTPCQVLPETRHQSTKEIPLVCTIGFQIQPRQTVKRSKRSESQTMYPFTYLVTPWSLVPPRGSR